MYIKLYTDGACSGNPGPGGYGCILSTVLPNGQVYETKHSGGYRKTTKSLNKFCNNLNEINNSLKSQY